ncbi:hypothetical protein EUTSA_v10010929mg [Eutrema salsugineum]|uniref:Uncharacterized protein n=2 Tax=Eutrema salsugineum TaxID=72664 RepID=V4LZJ3_EUTSA|nr:hypothetical protein EUTSA_v10010929mg [Eutrema salsugineum]
MEEGVPEVEKLSSPREVAEKNKDKTEQEQEQKGEETKGANGGILNNLISNFIDAATTTTTVDDKSGENMEKSEVKDEDEKTRQSSGAGILEKIISHLPAEDEVPTTEEATMLIHSVID